MRVTQCFEKTGLFINETIPQKCHLLIEKIKRVVSKIMDFIASFFTQKPIHPSAPIAVKINNPELQLDSTSSIVFNKKAGTYVYLSQAAPIKNLVISGGGAKGIVLPGVIKAFEDYKVKNTSFRDQLKNIAGSSIGAVTAALIASGMEADDLIATIAKEDFQSLLGAGIGPFFKDGKPLVNIIHKSLKNTISNYFKKVAPPDEIKPALIENGPITFSMLRSLHKLDPKVFKELTVTATCRETGTTFYFDADKTPNLDIAIACRASASLPIILSPVKIDRESLLPGYPGSGSLTFVDGGYLDNIPVVAMHDKPGQSSKGENGHNLQTLVLVFDETNHKGQSPFHEVRARKHVLYNPSRIKDRVVRDVIPKVLGGIATQSRNTLTKERKLEEIRIHYTQRCIPLSVPVKTNDFKKAKKLEKQCIEKGYAQAMEYLKNHECEMTYQTFNSFEALLAYFPEKKEQLSQFITKI